MTRSTPAPDPVRGGPSAGAAALRGYLGAAACAIVAMAAAALLNGGVARADLAMVLLLGVLGAGAAFGLRPALLCAAICAAGYNYLFLEPRFTWAIGRPADGLTFAVFFAAALATGWLSGRVRDEVRRTAERGAETLRLLAATRRLSAASTVEAAAEVLAEEVRGITGAQVVVLTGRRDDLQGWAGRAPSSDLDPASLIGARWSVDRGEPAGAGTEVSADAAWALRPLPGSSGAEGVLALRASTREATRQAADLPLLAGVLEAGGLVIERTRLAMADVENETLRRTDRLRGALLNSLSHDLKTPLAGILGSTTTLIDYGAELRPEVSRDLLQAVREEAERLGAYLRAILDLSRLEAGALAPRRDWNDLRDIAAAAADRTAPAFEGRPLARDQPEGVAMACVDPVLLEQALVNVLENAARHSPTGRPVSLCIQGDGDAWRILVEDAGPGLPPQALEQVFQPFARLDGAASSTVGSGLGLSIARGFVEAMGGTLSAESPVADGRGARFVFRLPNRGDEP